MDKKRILRLLIVDDSPDDTENTLGVLRQAGYQLKTQLVTDLAAFQAALDKNEWDAVLSEFTLPNIDAQTVLDHLKSTDRAIPVMVVTRAIADADLAHIMRFGARDVVLKDQLGRLTPALERELVVADERRAYVEAMQTLKETEDKHQAVIDSSNEAIGYLQDGMHIDANKPYLDIFRYGDAADLAGVPVMNLIDKKDQPRFKDYLRKPVNPASAGPQEFAALRQDGTSLDISVALSRVTIEGEACMQMVVADLSYRKSVESKLEYLSQRDTLTGLYNRHYFIQMLGKAVQNAKQNGATCGVLYLDMYRLPEITAGLGYAVGDRMLLKIVRILRESLGEGTVLARFRDNEFAALLNDTDAARLRSITKVLQGALNANPLKENNQIVPCDCTIAQALIGSKSENAQQVMAGLFADISAQRPAHAAPAAAAPDTPTTTTTAPAKPPDETTTTAPAKPPDETTTTAPAKPPDDWPKRIESALQNKSLQLSYQPAINLHGEPSASFEVLVRMTDRENELIPATEFMPPAEACGLSRDIDRWVTHAAIQTLADQHRAGRKLTFFVNLSATVFTDEQWLAQLPAILKVAGVAARYFVVELEEAKILANMTAAMTFVQALKKSGVAISIDNAGGTPGETGQLSAFPVAYLKLSSRLVREGMSGNQEAQATLTAAIEMAKTLHAKVIAKGVESADVLSYLFRLGVEYAQGDYFQPATATLDYDFGGETTLSSESDSPRWVSTPNGKSR